MSYLFLCSSLSQKTNTRKCEKIIYNRPNESYSQNITKMNHESIYNKLDNTVTKRQVAFSRDFSDNRNIVINRNILWKFNFIKQIQKIDLLLSFQNAIKPKLKPTVLFFLSKRTAFFSKFSPTFFLKITSNLISKCPTKMFLPQTEIFGHHCKFLCVKFPTAKNF